MENRLIPSVVLDTDSYKLSHWKQYPKNTTEMFSYFESRGGRWKSVMFFGLQYYIKKYFTKPITIEEVNEANEFAINHGCPFNYEGWKKIVNVYGGKLPVRIRAVPEGSIIPTRNILFSVESSVDDGEVFWITSWLETMLVRLWYPCTIATYSWNTKQTIKKYLDETADDTNAEINFKLHDFGSRGVTCQEQAMIGGAAHLVNFLGSDTIAGIWMANKFYNIPMAGYSIPACYDDKTDILTNSGWKKFKELTEKDLVGQYDSTGNITFVVPSKIHEYDFNDKLIHFTTDSQTAAIDLMVTPNHRMIRKSKATNNIEIFEAKDIKFSNKNVWLQGGTLSNCLTNTLTDVERLKIAFQADGSFPSRKEKYNGVYTGLKPIRFNLKKDRKINRLVNILTSSNIEFTKSDRYKNDKIAFWIKSTEEFKKDFSWIDLNNISLTWCKEFIEEIALWDGTIKGNNIIYTSCIEQNSNMVQLIAILAGYRSSIQKVIDPRENRKPIYQVNICKTSNERQGTNIKKQEELYNGKVYCVTVPSGMIIVRRNGYVSVSGNSEHSTMSMWVEHLKRKHIGT